MDAISSSSTCSADSLSLFSFKHEYVLDGEEKEEEEEEEEEEEAIQSKINDVM